VDLRAKYITKVVKGHSFADVGALWGINNEKVSVALKAGATQATIIDKCSLDDPLWQQVRHHINMPYTEISSDICEFSGSFGVVSCGGVIYHYPEPKKIMLALKTITKQYLVLTTTFTQEFVVNAKGSLHIKDALYLPNIDDHTREVVKEDWNVFLSGKPASGLVYVSDWTKHVLDHWWWLFTEKYLVNLFKECGLHIVESGTEGKTITFLLKNKQVFI